MGTRPHAPVGKEHAALCHQTQNGIIDDAAFATLAQHGHLQHTAHGIRERLEQGNVSTNVLGAWREPVGGGGGGTNNMSCKQHHIHAYAGRRMAHGTPTRLPRHEPWTRNVCSCNAEKATAQPIAPAASTASWVLVDRPRNRTPNNTTSRLSGFSFDGVVCASVDDMVRGVSRGLRATLGSTDSTGLSGWGNTPETQGEPSGCDEASAHNTSATSVAQDAMRGAENAECVFIK